MTVDHPLRTRLAVGWDQGKGAGAHRAGANEVVFPWANRKEVEHDVHEEVGEHVQFVSARTVREVLDAAFRVSTLPRRADAHNPLVESRL